MFARRRKPTYWDYSVNCTGNEAHLSSCKLGQEASLKSNGTCAQGLPVVVSCVPGRAFSPTPMMGFRKAFRQEVEIIHFGFVLYDWQKMFGYHLLFNFLPWLFRLLVNRLLACLKITADIQLFYKNSYWLFCFTDNITLSWLWCSRLFVWSHLSWLCNNVPSTAPWHKW